jgi:hypothetical protein
MVTSSLMAEPYPDLSVYMAQGSRWYPKDLHVVTGFR